MMRFLMSRTKIQDLPIETEKSQKDQSDSGQAQAERAPTRKEQKLIDAEEHTSAREKLSDQLND
ncbi:MAG: hypothetical protein CTY31_00500 [Hyphomicrobium sp.]|nr:MAG: hypothetical protein CTY39_03195 [Hyphomicrobium sp.]PPD01309.1 MAG: hypothetical protein CTY31_00500 [Hyphomicrobium sp.]